MASWVKIPVQAVQGNYLVDIGDLDAHLGALSEPLSCAVNNLSQLPIDEIESAVVIGLGPLGILHAITLRQMGVKTVIGSQSVGKRSELAAKAFAFDVLITPDKLSDECKKYNDGEGVDLVVVTAPNAAVQADAVNYVRKGGYVSLFASLPAGKEMVEFNSRTIHYGELKVYGCSDSTPMHVAKAVEMLSTKPDAYRPIVTGQYKLDEVNTAVERILSRDEMKVVLLPGDSFK